MGDMVEGGGASSLEADADAAVDERDRFG